MEWSRGVERGRIGRGDVLLEMLKWFNFVAIRRFMS